MLYPVELRGPQKGRVANSDVGRRMGGTGPRFQTLLTSGRPKQTASSWFCSHASQFASTAMARGAPGEVLSRWRRVSRRSARRGISLIARRRQDRPQRRHGMGDRGDGRVRRYLLTVMKEKGPDQLKG